MEDEGVLFEGLRLGSAQAFEELLRAQDATVRRLARLYVPEDLVGDLVLRTWSVALPGLDMFTWHTTLRAWLTGILVTSGRARAASAGALAPAGTPGQVATEAPGGAAGPGRDDVPWATLAWSDRWGPAGWEALEAALRARPLPEREVLWLHDVEGWPWREVLDTLGLTGEQGAVLLLAGRTALAGTVAGVLGAGPATPADAGDRLAGVTRLLGELAPRDGAAPPDPRLLRVFAAWRRGRSVRPVVERWHRWRWELGRARARRRYPSSSVPTVSPDSSPVTTNPSRR
ncbi:RNA polymerase sigma factor [Aquipuribacter hungaricus]|uniref:RNA polymerase sigma factor n=2 Tax=Aquipuribacter hungaricus TaxID=545624 RepID=A0ABV7WAZ1_9MICO